VVSRREFLKYLGVLAAGLAFGGVLGYSYGGIVGRKADRARIRELEEEVSELKEKLKILELEKEVRVYNWSWYIDERLINLFEGATGCKVVYETFESTDEVWAKLSVPPCGYDVVVISSYVVAEAAERELIVPLNPELIPNTKFLYENFKNPIYDPELKWHRPYMWGTTGIAYDTTLVEDDVTGWHNLFDFDYFLPKYAKKITMIPGSETVAITFKLWGASLNDLSEENIRKAKELLIKQKPYLAKYADATDYIPGLASKEFWVSMAWSGDAYVAKEENPDIRYVIPEEGTEIFVDCMVIPKGAPHPKAAHAWINFMLDPLVAAINSSTICYANPVKASEKFISEKVKKDPGIYPPPEVMAKLEMFRPWSPEEREIMEEVWMEIEAA